MPHLAVSPVSIGFQNQLQQSHHLIIIYAFSYLPQKDMVPNFIKVTLKFYINNSGFVFHNCLSYLAHRI